VVIVNHGAPPYVVILGSSLIPFGSVLLLTTVCLEIEFSSEVRDQISHPYKTNGLLHRVVWWLDTNVSEEHAASFFSVEIRGERKMDINICRV
jgi:hypothetical protein